MAYRFITLCFAVAVCATGCSSRFNEAEDAVRSKMKDGDSTQFRNLSYCGDDGNSVVRGEYNSKNDYGAYAGFSVFHYDAGNVELADQYGTDLIEKCSAQIRQQTEIIRARTKAMQKG